ncbi:LOW QUALITY PROTEIN: cilia- and flagella-associated protein 263 [Phoenicopterus ruber ruber]
MVEQDLAALPQLRAQLREERHANNLLQMEVEMCEKWYGKLEPCGPSLQLLSEMHDAPLELTQTDGRYKSKLHGVTDYFVGLTVEQKRELAEWELAHVKDEIQRMKEDSEQTLQNLRPVIEETDVWRTDVKKAISDFEKDIISTTSTKGSIIAPEKLLRYMVEKICQRTLLAKKLLSENILLKGYKKKLQHQLRQNEQMGETFREVRLQQLQVRNAQHQEKIDEKNQLLQLKLTLGKTLNSCKMSEPPSTSILPFFCFRRKLQGATETSTSLMKGISQKKELLEKIERETAVVEEEAKAESVNRQLRKQLSDYSPPVLSYVQKNMAIADPKKSIKGWERKVAIAEMSLQNYCRAQKQVKMSGKQQ